MTSSSAPQRDETHMVEGSANCEHEVNHIDDREAHGLNLHEEVSLLQAHKIFEQSSTSCSTSSEGNNKNQNGDKPTATFQPILPWITVTQNPGILEDDILSQVEVLNPQSCRKLLDSMILDKHLIVRKITRSTSLPPPALLGSLFGSQYRPKFVCRQHYFANPMSTSLL